MTPAGYGEEVRFPSTRWSLVDLIRRGDDTPRREALGELLRRYLPALRAHLVHGKGLKGDESDDLIQEFIASKVLEKDLIAQANRDLGRFRTFVLAALDRFLIDSIRQKNAKKRSPNGGVVVSMGEEAERIRSDQTPSDAFDAAWARSVIDEALRRMRHQCETSGRADLWGVFECRLVDPILKGAPPADYQRLVQRFGLKSPAQASNVLITAKRMYARALRSVVAEYAWGDRETESEIMQLREMLARSRG